MLGKIIKNEFKSTYKLMLSILGLLLLLSVMGGISVRSLAMTSEKVSVASVLGTVLYFLSFVAVFIIVIVYVGQRFYKTMFSTQGYLTHTLPVKESSIFNGKLLVSFIWVFSVFLMIFVSLLIMGSIASDGKLFSILVNEAWAEFVQDLYEEFNINVTGFLWKIVLSILLGIVYMLLWIFTSLSVGQLSNKHRIAASVFTGIGIYIVEEIFSVLFIVSIAKKAESFVESAERAGKLLNENLWIGMGYMVLSIAIMYTVCMLINKKKLNLE